MKKFTLKHALLTGAICACGTLSAQQNLVMNPGFDEWTGDNPTGWTLKAGNTDITLTKAEMSGHGNVVKVANVGTKGNGEIKSDAVVVTAPGTYTFSFQYYVDPVTMNEAGMRHWAFVNREDGTQPNKDDADFAQYDAIAKQFQYEGNSNAYSPTNITGEWLTETLVVDITLPVSLNLMSRTYKETTVYYDNFTFIAADDPEAISASETHSGAYAAGGTVYVPAKAGETISVYTVAGHQVATKLAVDGENPILGLNAKQLYIIKVNGRVSKVIL